MTELRDLYGWSSGRMPSPVYAHITAERTRSILSAVSPIADQRSLTSNNERGQDDEEQIEKAIEIPRLFSGSRFRT